ncbi:MAG: thiopeptide-type bacteriocin biosynthesis protein [Clostridia bacterium]|nr:thiopeptide-type bacteriocin biosynthesis protein [Clostridia bacterium]
MKGWRALHIFHHAINMREMLLIYIHNIVRQLFADGKISSWFYINYWEGGPHVRLRLKDIDDADFIALKTAVSDYLADNPSTSTLSKEQYYKHHKFDGVQQDTGVLPWYGDNVVEEIQYVPETERYGGRESIGLAEDFFMISSETAMAIIKNVPAVFGIRLSLSTDIYIASLDICGLLKGRFLRQVSDYWKLYSDSNIEKMNADPKTNAVFLDKLKYYDRSTSNTIVRKWREEISRYHEKLKEKIADPNVIAMVLISQLHMLNNRLSVPPAYEYMITKVLSKCLGDEQGA